MKLDVAFVKDALDKETATSLLIEVVQTCIIADEALEGSTCTCCKDKRTLLARLKNAGVVKKK